MSSIASTKKRYEQLESWRICRLFYLAQNIQTFREFNHQCYTSATTKDASWKASYECEVLL